MNEETFKNYLEQAERRLRALEDSLMSDPITGKKQPERDAKLKEVDEFIQAMKEINESNKPGNDNPGKNDAGGSSSVHDEADEFIRMMKEINIRTS